MKASEGISILVQKRARALLLYADGRLERTFTVALGRNWAADKSIEGDEATPLGEFYVCAKNPRSKYFLSLCISYPNGEDADRGLTDGLISAAEHAQIHEALRLRRTPPQHTRLGGEIYIHGASPVATGTAPKDWTRGCIALENPAMRELYGLVSVGTPVVIVA